jgi:hypothetical protein
MQLDPVIAPEAGRAQVERFRGASIGEEFLRQRRTLIGRIRLIPDDGDGLIECALPQACGQLSGCLTSTDDDGILAHEGVGDFPGVLARIGSAKPQLLNLDVMTFQRGHCG